MKRLSKILVAVAALCLLVGALALAISANSGIDGKFVVKGKGYETWDEAVAASANTHTIYLNEDWTLDKGLTLSGADKNLKINLNGKTVSVKDGSMLFNVHTNAKLTIEGEGTINNAGAVAIGGSSYGVVTVNATGKGIVINNNATSGDVNTFRFTTYSTLNVSGKIVVNTNGKTSSRAIFNVADSSRKTVNLNITDADILFATPTVAGAPAGKVIYSQFSNVKIESSRLEGVYCYVIYAATTGTVDLAGYIIDKDPGSAVSYGWDPAKLGEIKNISITIGENYTVNNSVIASTKATGYDGNISGSMMLFTGPTKADFTNCEIYGHYRAIYGKQANDSWNNIATKKTDASQLTFVDCHIRPCDGGTIPYLVCYGPNARFFGGSISGVTNLANCQPHYIELNNGQWLGVYVDNVLGPSKLNNNTVITTAWQNTTNYNPASTIVGTLPKPVTLTVGGKEVSFTTGYFSDEAKYDAYFAGLDADSWENYIVQKSDANVEGGSFVKDGASAAVGTNPLGTAYTFNTDKGTSSYVLGTNKRGELNGYVKHYMAANSGSQSSSSRYQQIVTGYASFAKTEAYVWEWDVSTDDAQFIQVSFSTQAREKTPRFDKSGNYLGLSSMQYRNPTGIWIRTTNKLEFNGKSVDLSTAKGDWTRITVVYDIVRGELTSIDVPVYTDVNTPATDGSTVKKNAYKLSDSKIHVYVDGILLASADFFPTEWGYNGYVIEGYEDNYYFDQIRIAPSAASANGSYCVDNVRTSAYPIGAGVDLGIYNKDGSIKTDINGLDHFLVMPDNMATASALPAVTVDGVEYFDLDEAFAAIREGSTVKLFKDIESAIKADVAFKLYPNGFKFGGFISATHKPVDYVSGMGFYKLVPADASELYTVNYSFSGVTKQQIAVMETIIPELSDRFPGKLNGNLATQISYWAYDGVLSDYYLSSNDVYATPITEEVIANFELDGYYYENFFDAFADAEGATIVFRNDLTLDNSDVSATTYKKILGTFTTESAGVAINSTYDVTLDFNGKTVDQNFSGILFNVTDGTLTLKGAATFNGVGTFARVAGKNAKVVVDATGDGFDINSRGGEFYNVFVAEGGADLAVSGVVDIYSAYTTTIFRLSGSDTTEFINANVTSYGPSAEIGKLYSDFFYLADGNTVNIESSTLTINCGDMFQASASDKSFSIANYLASGYLYADSAKLDENGKIKDVYFPDFTINVTANNSTIIAALGEPGAADQGAVGGLFRIANSPMKVVMTNCELQGNSRVIQGGSRPNATKKVSPNQFLFTDVNYSAVDSSKSDSPNFLQENINIIWNGGTINCQGTPVGCAFAPMEAQNGVIGAHFFNTNLATSTKYNPNDLYDWEKSPGTNAWTRYWSSVKGVAYVDNVLYETEAEAIAAIVDGSKVKLMRDFSEGAVAIALACTIDTNGRYYKAPQFISATHKVELGANGVITLSAAAANEIFTVNYTFGDKTKTQTAALGTLMVAPDGFDEYTFSYETMKYTFFKGWVTTENGAPIIVVGNMDATPVLDIVDPVVIYWTDETGEKVLDIDHFFPGEKTKLDAFDGVDIPVDHSYDYYGYGRSGWTGIEEATAGLATAGEYTIKAVMGKVAPDTFPGLKYNLMLCSNYVMNFYVPQGIEGISAPVLSLNVDGTALLPQFEAGTIDGESHDVFGYMLGIADTEIKTFYLVYTIGEDKLAFPVYVGVPSYAAEVMKQYAEDESAKGEAAKTLVVNMANYATKVFALNGGVDVEASGAKIYYEILAQYGEEYLGYYESLTNDRFATGGDLYAKHQVSKLNWIAGSEDAGDSEALGYIKSIGFSFNTFEPAYVIKFSDAAIAKGLQEPDASGATEHYKAGLHVYAGFDGLLAAKLWAENGGNKYYGEADVWGENGNADYDYFAMATNSTWDTTGANFNIDNIRNDLTIKVYFCENDVTSAVGEVNYNLAAYINSMLKDAEGNAAYIEAAKAIYAYSYVSAVYNAS